MRSFQILALATALSFFTLACSRSPGVFGDPAVSDTPATATADVVLTTAGNTSLFSFSARITELRLREESGDLTDNLLAGAIDLELLHSSDSFEWLLRTDFEEGRYTAVVLQFADASYEATANDGSPVTVEPLSNELIATFPVATELDSLLTRRLEVVLDLGASFAPTTPVSVDFAPSGGATVGATGSLATLESRIGVVRARDIAEQTIDVELFADQSLSASIGTVTTRVPSSALLVDTGDFIQTSVPFFLTFLTPGLSIIDVNGILGDDGELIATRIELEDQNGTVVSPNFPLKLQGRVEGQVSSTVFTVRVRNVLRGSGSIAVGSVVDFAVDPLVGLFFADSFLGGPGDIAPGLEIELKSRQLSTSPVFARSVALGGTPAIVGEIANTDALPASVRVQVDPLQAALTPGQVLTSQTQVTVPLSPGTVFLATPAPVALDSNDIRPGLGIELRGTVSGPPSMPLIDATRIDVLPGTLVGAQVTVPTAFGFAADGGSVTSPFSETIGVGFVGPLQVEVTSETLFRGAATSQAELNSLLFAGESVFATVSGIESNAASRIVAYDVLVLL